MSSLHENCTDISISNLSKLHSPPLSCSSQAPGELCDTSLALDYIYNKIPSCKLCLRSTLFNPIIITIDPSTTTAHLNYDHGFQLHLLHSFLLCFPSQSILHITANLSFLKGNTISSHISP